MNIKLKNINEHIAFDQTAIRHHWGTLMNCIISKRILSMIDYQKRREIECCRK